MVRIHRVQPLILEVVGLQLVDEPDAAASGDDADEESREKVIVRQLGAKNLAGQADVSVTAFGLVQEYKAVRVIFGDAGDDNDTINLGNALGVLSELIPDRPAVGIHAIKPVEALIVIPVGAWVSE